MLTQEDKINLQLRKKIMTEKKTSLLPLRNQDWKNQGKTEKGNKLFPNISTDCITELNEQIYAGAKLVNDKISVPLGNSNRNTKP